MELHLSKLFGIIYQNYLKHKFMRKSIFLKKENNNSINNIQKLLTSKSNPKSNSKESNHEQIIDYYKELGYVVLPLDFPS